MTMDRALLCLAEARTVTDGTFLWQRWNLRATSSLLCFISERGRKTGRSDALTPINDQIYGCRETSGEADGQQLANVASSCLFLQVIPSLDSCHMSPKWS